MACDYVFRPVLDIHIRCDADVLYVPLAFAVEEAAAGGDHGAAIDEERRIGRVHQASPRALADEFADLAVAEHPGHQVAAGTGHFVDDHHLRSPDAGGGAGEGVAVASDVVEVAVEIALQDVDDVIGSGTAAVVALVDHRALFILLGEVVAIETGVTGLAGVRQMNVRQLAAR